MVNKYRECVQRMNLSLVTKKMQIKTRWRYHNTPTRMAKIKGLTIASVVEHMKQLDLSLIAGGSANTSII